MAAGPGGKSVGRVSIRVVPDASRFKADLKKSLERIEKSTVLELPVEANTRPAEVSLRKFQKDWNGQSVTLDVDAKTLAAATHLAEFTRRRDVNVGVKIDKASLARASATIIASLSGARLAGDLVKNVSTRLQNLDRSLPRIAAVGFAIASLGSLAISSVGGIVTLAASLASLAALAAPMPALFAAAGVSAIVLAVALKDAGNQLSGLAPLWSQLRSTITDNFWEGARQPIIDLVEAVFPQLEEGLRSVSAALGVWAGSVATSFQNAFGGDVITGMMAKLSEAITNSTAGTDAFAASIATLGTFGSQYLPAIGTWFSDISVRFNAWIGQVAADGTLSSWVATGMTALGQLGQVIQATVGIIGGIASAAEAAGGEGLGTLAQALLNISEAVNGPLFQGALTTIFGGAAAGASALGEALKPIGAMVATLAPTIANVMTIAGATIAATLTAISDALSDPLFAGGLQALFAGLSAGITAILPALPALSAALGAVASFAGLLAAQLGPVLGAVLAALAPVVTDLLGAVQPLIPALGGALVSAVQALAPLLSVLAPILSPIISMIAALMPVVTPIVQLLVSILTPLLQLLVPILGMLATAFGQIMTALMPIILQILPPLTSLFAALLPPISAVLDAVMQILQPILDLITPLLQLIGPILNPLIELLTMLLGAVLQPLTQAFQFLGPVLTGVASAIGDILLPVVESIRDVLGGLITFLTGVFTGDWEKAWSGIVQIFTGLWTGIVNTAKGILNAVIDIINGLIGGVNAITSSVGIPAIPNIPKLATGADVEPTPGGTVVRLGEGGQAETVTNRGATNRMIEATNRLLARSLGQGQQSANVSIYPTFRQDDPTLQMRQWAREARRAF